MLFDYVVLPPTLQNPNITDGNGHIVRIVTKLSRYSGYHIKEALVFFTTKHAQGLCFNGEFDSKKIKFWHGLALLDGVPPVIIEEHDVSGLQKDYKKLYEIFGTIKDRKGNYAIHYVHFLTYLKFCPLGKYSIMRGPTAFLVNHPTLQFYQARYCQCLLLDNMLFRIEEPGLNFISDAMGENIDWMDLLSSCPELDRVLWSGPFYDMNGDHIINPLFSTDPLGCVHYLNILMKHAKNSYKVELVDAAFALNSKDFLPEVLQNIVMSLSLPQHGGRWNQRNAFLRMNPEFLDLIENPLATSTSGDPELFHRIVPLR